MNLAETINQTELRAPVRVLKPQTRSKYQVAKRVFELASQGGFPYKKATYQGWADKWLPSDEFRLMEIDIAAAAAININAAASPHQPKNPNRVEHYLHCSVDALDPIVVDVNKRNVGRSYLGYVPPVVVLDGKHRKRAQLQKGYSKILAWVGCKAIKKMPKCTLHEVGNGNGKVILPPVDGTKIAAAYEIFASTVPSVGIPAIRQDSGEGGSRPKDSLHSGGPGSGRHKGNEQQGNEQLIVHKGTDTPTNTLGKNLQVYQKLSKMMQTYPKPEYIIPESRAVQKEQAKKGMKSMGGPGMSNQGGGHELNIKSGKVEDCDACGARSSGTLVDDSSASDHKIPPDASDAGQAVDSSDQLGWDGRRSQLYAPGTRPGYSDQFGSPNFQAPGAGVGQRVRNTGASNSDFSRTLLAGGPGSGRHAGAKRFKDKAERDVNYRQRMKRRNAADTEQSDREYIKQQQDRARGTKEIGENPLSVRSSKTIKKIWTKKNKKIKKD
jgi:hypothetical protein